MFKPTKSNPNAVPTTKSPTLAQAGAVASATPAQMAQAKANVQAPAQAPQATPKASTVPGLRTLPGSVLKALVAKGASISFIGACPKRPGSKAASAWPTMAKANTVAEACQGPLGAADVAYALAHGQAVATVPNGPTVGTLGQPLSLDALAQARAALGC